MAHHVCVKKVTVEYAAGGQRFRVDFDPMRIMAIVFSQTELDRMNATHALPQPLGLGKEDLRIQFDATKTFEEQEKVKHAPGAKISSVHGDATDDGAPLWWYTDANTWFHPQV